jgi:hypothetical protein
MGGGLQGWRWPKCRGQRPLRAKSGGAYLSGDRGGAGHGSPLCGSGGTTPVRNRCAERLLHGSSPFSPSTARIVPQPRSESKPRKSCTRGLARCRPYPIYLYCGIGAPVLGRVGLRPSDGGSSNGRTADSDSASLGSNPSPPAIRKPRIPCLLGAGNAREIRTNTDGRRTKPA